MIFVDITSLLNQPEQVAFLPPDSSADRLAQTLVALANGPGGYLVIGLSKSGKPQPLLQPQAAQDRLMAAALQCDPPLIISTPAILPWQDGFALVATVPPDLPNVYNFEGQYLVWAEGKNAPLKGADLRRLIFARTDSGFDGEIQPAATPADLDWEAVRAYVASVDGLRRFPAEEALLKRGCLKPDGSVLRPTRAGLLLFGLDPQKWLPQAEITVARYTGLQMSDAFVRADLRGTIPEQARRAEAFVLENIGRGVNLSGLQRAEDYLYPVSAVREMIVNALAHRDYSVSGDNIRLLLFANRLECYSPGRLPGHITVTNILQERFSRNATLVQVLFEMGFIERLGYGIDRIVRSVAEQGLPPPAFEERPAGFMLTIFGNPQTAPAGNPGTIRRWLEMGLNERQIRALGFLAEQGRINNADYQALCPDISPETLRRDLADLVTRDLLLRIGEKRATFYILK